MKFPSLPALSFAGLTRGSRTSLEFPHSPPRTRSQAKVWKRGLLSAALALGLGAVAEAQAPPPPPNLTLTGPAEIGEGENPGYRISISAKQPAAVNVRIRLERDLDRFPSVILQPVAIVADDDPTPFGDREADFGNGGFDANFERVITIPANQDASPEFQLNPLNDSYTEGAEAFGLTIVDRGGDFGVNGNGEINGVVRAQGFTPGQVMFSSSNGLEDGCGIDDSTLSGGVCENERGRINNPISTFSITLDFARPANRGGQEPLLQYQIESLVRINGPGAGPLIAAIPGNTANGILRPTVFSTGEAGAFFIRYPRGMRLGNATIQFAVTYAGDDSIAPIFQQNLFQQQTPQTLTVSNDITDEFRADARREQDLYPVTDTVDSFTIRRFDPHGLNTNLPVTNFITSEDPDSSIRFTDIPVNLRGVNVPYNGGTTIAPFIINPDGSFNTDAAPGTDTFIPIQTSDASEGLVSYYVRLRDPNTNLPTGAPIFIQAVPQTELQLRFSVNPAEPEYFGNYHYVRVTGVDDATQDGDQLYQVFVPRNPTSFDSEFNQLDLTNSRFNLRNQDDEQNASPGNPGVIYSRGGTTDTSLENSAPALETSETEKTDFFNVRLSRQPGADNPDVSDPGGAAGRGSTPKNSKVVLVFRTNRPDEVRIVDPTNPANLLDEVKLTFFANTVGNPDLTGPTSSLWNVARRITVQGIDDDASPTFDGNQPVVITAETLDTEVVNGVEVFATEDPAYRLIDPFDPTVTNLDNESRDVTLSTSTISVNEGSTESFTVRLNSRPSSNVTINLSVVAAPVAMGQPAEDATAVRIIAGAVLVFTPEDFLTPKTVTIAGISDGRITPAQRFATIRTSNTSSSDPAFNDVVVGDIAVTVQNTDSVVRVSPTNGLRTSESGTTATFQVVLAVTPTAPVNITLTANNPAEARLLVGGALTNSQTITFTPADAATPQTITVQGVPDAVVDGDQPFRISGTIISADPTYNSIEFPAVNGINTDVVPVITKTIVVGPDTIVVTNENGTVDTFTVALSAQPSDPVTVTFTSSDFTEAGLRVGTGTPAASVTLTFTAANAPQTVSVVGIDDDEIDADQLFTITGTVASVDAGFQGVTVPTVFGTNQNLDEPVVRVEGTTYDPNGRYLVSVPYTFETGEALSVADAFGPSSDSLGLRYTLYRFNAGGQIGRLTTAAGEVGTDFVELTDSDLVARGEGYLLVTYDTTVFLTTPEDNPALVAGTETAFPIKLFRNPNFVAQARRSNSFNGYNLIGFPFDPTRNSVSLANVQVSVGGRRPRTFESLRAAAAAGVIRGRIYGLDANGRLRDLGRNLNLGAFSAVFVQTFRDDVTITLRNSGG